MIEVVPKATPFLLSIHAMKTLGACIDLENNQCYLEKLGRSLQLRQGRNGLYLVNLQELCLPDEEKTHDSFHVNSTATAASRVSSSHDSCSTKVFLRIMPSQREVTEALKATAQSVVESLKFLLVILMSQLEAVDPERAVLDDQAQAIQRLNNEVMSQRNRIEEIAHLLRQPGSPSRSEFNLSTALISDDESEHVDLAGLPMAETSPPTRTPATVTSQRAAPTRAMVNPSVPAPSNPANYPAPTSTTPTAVVAAATTMPGTQLVHTAQALESWGNKRISWGKRHAS